MIEREAVAAALQMEIEFLSINRYLVRSRLSSHVVYQDACDCGASRPGYVCPHRIRVCLDQVAPEILTAIRSLVQAAEPSGSFR